MDGRSNAGADENYNCDAEKVERSNFLAKTVWLFILMIWSFTFCFFLFVIRTLLNDTFRKAIAAQDLRVFFGEGCHNVVEAASSKLTLKSVESVLLCFVYRNLIFMNVKGANCVKVGC